MRSDEIFLIQGILMRFKMMDYKSRATPIMTNIKKIRDSTSDSYLVDPTMYMQLIGSLMYLVNVGMFTGRMCLSLMEIKTTIQTLRMQKT
jgi:hypothetical protein